MSHFVLLLRRSCFAFSLLSLSLSVSASVSAAKIREVLSQASETSLPPSLTGMEFSKWKGNEQKMDNSNLGHLTKI